VGDVDLKTMLDDRAEEMRLDPRMPARVLRRARRRRAANAALAGAVTVGLALGAFVGARALLEPTPSLRPTTPSVPTEEFYPFIYPPTLEELEVTQEQVAQGSMPMWTEPEGAAILFAVNVMGWDMDDVEVDVDRSLDGFRAVITNPPLSRAAGIDRDIRTTLFLLRVPETDVYAVLAALAEGLEFEPIGADEEFGAGGAFGVKGSYRFVPEGALVTLTVNGQPPVSFGPGPDGEFELNTEVRGALKPTTLVSVAVQDASGNTLALTSSRIASPVAGTSEAGASEASVAIPARVADTRQAILDAAQARDFQALRALIPDDGFTFSYGGETDPIAFWKRLESEGHVPVFGDILPMVLNSEPGFDRGIFVWPAQAAEDPAEWDESDIEALTAIHAEEDIRSFQDAGVYLGWRVGIDRDGTWVFFVAGD
jgi:hypothetical protein